MHMNLRSLYTESFHSPDWQLNNAGSTSQSQTRDSRYTHETQRIVAHISSSPVSFPCPLILSAQAL